MSDALKQIWEKVDQMIGPQRMETEAEHIARDMREGRFPKRSDPIQVPVEGPTAIASHLAPGDDLMHRVAAAQAAFAHPFRPTMGPVAAGKLIDDLAARVAALTATVAELQNGAVLSKAAYDGVSSLLLSVQKDCIAAVNEAATLLARLARMEGAQKLREEIAALEKLCDHDCDNEDCVRCFHYPEILEQKRKQLTALTDGGSNG